MTLTQDVVREKFIEKTNAFRQTNIAKETGIQKEMLSRFKSGSRDLWDESLEALNDYLDNH